MTELSSLSTGVICGLFFLVLFGIVALGLSQDNPADKPKDTRPEWKAEDILKREG